MPFGEPGIQAITLSLIALAAVWALASVMVGVYSVSTARDALPPTIRSLMRRTPASAEDFRLRGASLMLTGAGVMLIAAGLTINIVAALALVPPGVAYVTSESLAFSKATMFLVTSLAAVAAVALFVGAYAISVRVHYLDTPFRTRRRPEHPPG